MEELTKQQIVLLVLLVSFVTSIATGIVTVSLMNQAPVGVTQTINRVVERTIEKVTAPSSTSTEIIKETIVVDQGDQVVKAIQKNANSLVRIYKPTEGGTIAFVAIGTVISDDGIIATDNNVIHENVKYFITTDDSKLHDLQILRSQDSESVALLKMKPEENSVTFAKVDFNTNDLQLGQSVAYIGGDTKNAVATGIVSSINTKEASSTKIISSIETTIPSKNFISGALLLNLSGELVGVKIGDSSNFVPSLIIKNIMDLYIESLKKTS